MRQQRQVKSGRSAARLDSNIVGQYARNQGMMMDNLMRCLSMQQATDGLRNQFTSANNRAFDRVAIAPQHTIAPLAPVQVSGPSTMSLLVTLVELLLSGVGLCWLSADSATSIIGWKTDSFQKHTIEYGVQSY